MTTSFQNEWWRGAVVYQVYPRSYKDTNADGVGDLKGITEKLDYIASLGVDAIWLSPFFKSPMKDYGYDVSDYCDVDPLFGTLADFKILLDRAHSLGLKIVIDQVLSHTSNEHPWFQESRASRTSDKADWYVWADPKPDGSPPNNWQSVFGGSSWQFDMRRGQYYLHNFLVEQPDLNLHNPEVRKALIHCCRFWLEQGVDGFRLDAIPHCFHNQNLKDNPVNPHAKPSNSNVDFVTPYTMQQHVNDIQIPESIAFMEEIRVLLDEYEGRMAVAEVGGEEGVILAAQYTDGPQRLHTAYNFSLISGTAPSAKRIRDALEEFAEQPGQGWPSWAFSNHDVVRVASRWHPQKDGYHHDPRLSKMLIALLCSLRGTIFLYQGEELGLPEAFIPYEKIQDPWGKYLYPLWQGRDGCRTPIPWQHAAPQAGFTDAAEPWLPICGTHLPLAIDSQELDATSALHFTRRFLQWRRKQPAMVAGDLKFLTFKDDMTLGFQRQIEGQTIFCIFNLDENEKTLTLPAEIGVGADLAADGLMGTLKSPKKAVLPAYGFYFGISAAT